MNKTIASIAVAGALASAVACGSDDTDQSTSDGMDNGTEQMTTPPTGGMTEESEPETSPTDLGMIDQAKLASFVVAFRAGYSELAQDRDDSSIELIVLQSCEGIANGVDEQQVTDEIRTLAAHNGNEPTQDQAEQIYDMVTPACPG
ncbi:hypothetical protein [Rhodococcus sp. 24CO]|uniref:hypothetical protein n=1 Tax=Rhodococcus sp. 24CO TaxID=3117460 RepID=UPI003D358C1B